MNKEEAHSAWLETDRTIPFDPLAQDPSEWEFLQESLPGVVVSSAGLNPLTKATVIKGLLEKHPFLLESTADGTSLLVGDPDGMFEDANILYSSHFASPLINTIDDVRTALIATVTHLNLHPFEYKFKAKLIESYSGDRLTLSHDLDDIVSGLGITPEDGYKMAKQNNINGLTAAGFTIYSALSLWEARQVEETPINKDPRNFPETYPTFEVHI